MPVLSVGGAGAIDGLAGVFPKCLVHLFDTWQKDPGDLKRLRELQYKFSAGEELVVKHQAVGIKEAVSRILGLGDRDGTRLPLKGGFAGGDAEWKEWEGVMGALQELEDRLPEVAK